MSATNVVGHDFTCPGCWIGWRQAERPTADSGVDIERAWFELTPEGLPWDPPAPRDPIDPSRPPIASRLELAFAADGLDRPRAARPQVMQRHNAHEAVEQMKTEWNARESVGRPHRAFGLEGLEFDSVHVIGRLAEGLTADLGRMHSPAEARLFAGRTVPFDDQACACGVLHVPTLCFGGARYAGRPYRLVARAVREWLA